MGAHRAQRDGRNQGRRGQTVVRDVVGTVAEQLPSALYRVRLDGGGVVVASIADRIDRNFVRVLVGDRVRLEMSPVDVGRGRIVQDLLHGADCGCHHRHIRVQRLEQDVRKPLAARGQDNEIELRVERGNVLDGSDEVHDGSDAAFGSPSLQASRSGPSPATTIETVSTGRSETASSMTSTPFS